MMLVLDGAIEMAACPAVPERETAAGLPLEIVSEAERGPGVCDAAGLNVTLTWQLLPAPRLGAHGFARVKSPGFAPLMAIVPREAVAWPVLEIVTICASLAVP